jgi:methylase of polypeptide subunit release factors
LDLCTGSGCIPLLSYYEFSKNDREVKDLEVVSVDISTTAIALANKNLQRMISDGTLSPEPNLRFLQADILTTKDGEGGNDVMALDTALQHYTSTSTSTATSAPNTGRGNWDILISNPPYISPSAFAHTTTRSVKRYEPRLALVPPYTSSSPSASPSLNSSTAPSFDSAQADTNQGDLFYPRLLSIAAALSTKVLLFEVADLEQAKRVADMARKQGIWEGIEIWRDDPCGGSYDGSGQGDGEGDAEMVEDILGMGIKVLGAGNGRTVVAYRGEGKDWMCTGS